MKVLRYRYLFLLLFAFAAGSCIGDEMRREDVNNTDNLLKVRLNLPAMQKPASNTRAMSYDDENTLVQDLLSVMIIKENVVSKASLVGSVIYDANDHSKATITVRLPESEDQNDKIRLCVIANHTLVGDSGDFDTFKAAQLLDMNGVWPTSQAIPMWGESGEIVVDDAMAIHTIDMYRALARIDVGLMFISQEGNPTEDAEGLDNFTINSISVHNTKTRILVAPANIPPISPNAPDGFTRSYDDPLVFEPLGGVDSYVREIYVPEAGLPDPFAVNETHCVIVGGFYDESTTETFYRLEFATDNSDGSETYLPLLRNHRYVFNIIDVTGPGYASRLDAFNAEGLVANRIIDYDLIVLDESIHRIEFKDGNFFGLDDRNLMFAPQAGNILTVKYQTNLPETETLTFDWADPTTGETRYNIIPDPNTKSFTVETLTENTSGSVYTDLLYVKLGSFSIPVSVKQDCVDLSYSINAGSVTVSGIYVMGEALNSSHYITLTITAADASIAGKPFVLQTEERDGDHGISFSASGTFDFSGIAPGDPLVMTIVLQGSGTLSMDAGSDPFKLRINTNSILGDYQEVTIVPVNPNLNIVVMSLSSNAYGYAISRTNGGAGQVFSSTNNFGPYDHSIVKISGVNYINTEGYYDFSLYTTRDIYKWVTGIGNNGKLADMVYIAYDAIFGNDTAQLLAEYLQNGGVIVACLQSTTSIQYLMRNVFSGAPGTITATHEATLPRIIPMPANPKLFTTTDSEEYRSLLWRLEGDPILNGPFGDIRDKQIGEDASSISGISNLPAEGVTVYAYANDINASPIEINSTRVVGFKLEEDGSNGRNLFFWGDGGLMSSPYSGTYPHDGQPATNLTGYTICPFWWDTTTFFPIPRPTYGPVTANRMPVYNSTMFCNTMAWAIKRSQEQRARRLEFEQNHVEP